LVGRFKNFKGKDNLKILHINEGIILICILKQCVRMWI
jgi:hypothetical protein